MNRTALNASGGILSNADFTIDIFADQITMVANSPKSLHVNRCGVLLTEPLLSVVSMNRMHHTRITPHMHKIAREA